MKYFGSAHWFLPWLILVIGMYSIVRFARGYIHERVFTQTDQRLMTIFSGLMDLQGLLGLIFFLGTGFAGIGFPIDRILHGLAMIAAVVIPHFSRLWKTANNQTRHVNNFFAVLSSFLLILFGLAFVH
jgi:hypothetical protein